MNITKLLLVTLALAWFTSQHASGQGLVTLDHVDGAVDTDKILSDREIVFNIRVSNLTNDTLSAILNSFRIYSPDGATWTPWIAVDTYFAGPPPTTIFDTTFYGQWIDPPGVDIGWFPDSNPLLHIFLWRTDFGVSPEYGIGADTIGFAGEGSIPPAIGVPVGFDEIALTITIQWIWVSEIGRTICLDSAVTRNGVNPVEIKWVTKDLETIYPEWDGPHCFTITDQCCWGMRGNVNRDWKDTIDISDLTALVGWMFKSGSAPPCMLEADVDGNSDHDIADVTHLVGYMFKSGPAPVGCP